MLVGNAWFLSLMFFFRAGLGKLREAFLEETGRKCVHIEAFRCQKLRVGTSPCKLSSHAVGEAVVPS